eukprot:CAMPEP_0114511340 /NCGR_PEP_ID=MMETSP0109-20121206/14307_1 /TAXON_ID=29199 /ORGANISM="Chlorarachnion reptans, Strain CCCM449" /LENGTH=111 /DNA_ID=CAMNT_0001690785 /DNA_START=178 /DNA_END=510 /DNA_ORIENTATION=+
MPEVLVGSDAISNQLLHFLKFWKPSLRRPVEHNRILHPDVELPGLRGRGYCDLSQALFEGDEKLLSHPSSTQTPSAARAILDEDPGAAHPALRLRLRPRRGLNPPARIGES